MRHILLNTDVPVLDFNEELTDIHVFNDDFLPFALKGITSTESARSLQQAVKDISLVRDFFSNRVLNLLRENAKVILNVANLPQTLKTEDRLKIVFACRALNIEDNFWIKQEDEHLKFQDVNLRKHSLNSNISYEVAILGKYVSATRDELKSDITAGGMYPKFWHRNGQTGKLELWKTDKINGLQSKNEVLASELLTQAHGYCVPYRLQEKDGLFFSVSECFTDDKISLAKAGDIKDFCVRHSDRISFESTFMHHPDFADMVIADYVLGNTDRHKENWGFIIDNTSNTICGFAPLYDFNQALLIDALGNSDKLDDLIYEPTGMTFKESARKYINECSLEFSGLNLPKEARMRWDTIQNMRTKTHDKNPTEDNER